MNQKQRKFPCVYMRGGTSKAVFFHKEDLPADESEALRCCSASAAN